MKIKTFALNILALVAGVALRPPGAQAGPLPIQVQDYEAAVKAESSLVSYYTFDAANASDSVGTNNGALTGSTQFVPGFGGGPDEALSLNGAGWDSLGIVPAFEFSGGSGTVDLWLQATWTNASYNPCVFASREDSALPVNYSIHMASAKDRIYFWNGTSAPSIALPSSAGTNWHHLGVIFGNGSWTVVWDSQICGSNQLSNTGSQDPVQLGSSNPSGTEFWLGNLDEVAFYSQALDPADVASHFLAGIANFPPIITSQPQAGDNLPAGLAFSRSLSVESFLPVSYQWYKNGSTISGKTTNSFSIASLAQGDAGTYVCVITNANGAVTSSPVVLQVSTTVSAQVKAYQSAVKATAGLISYYTFDNETANDSVATNNGSLSGPAEFIAGFGGGPDQGFGATGQDWVALGSVPAFDFLGGAGTIELWLQAGWNPDAIGYAPCIFADRNDSASAVNYSMHMAGNGSSVIFYNGSGTSSFSLPAAAGTNWHHMAVIFTNGNWSIIWDGQSLGSLTFPLGGSPADVDLGSSNPGGTEQWVGGLDEVAFYNIALSSNAVTAHYDAFGAPPLIEAQPEGRTIFVSETLNLSVVASGAQLAYQWYKNGSAITSATNEQLSILDATTNTAGSYLVKVSNTAGSVTSSNAVVAVSLGNPSDPIWVQNYESSVRAENSLISFYTFDNSTADDTVGTNNGVLEGTNAFVPGFGGGPDLALSLAGAGWVNLSNSPPLEFTGLEGTVDLWLKADWASAGANPCVFASRDDPDFGASDVNFSIHMGSAKDRIYFWNGTSAPYILLPQPAGTNWHHLGVIFDNGSWTVVWDGVDIGSGSLGQGPGLTDPIQIGSSSPHGDSENWPGELDEVAFYGAALDPTNIYAHYLAGTSNAPPAILTEPQSGDDLLVGLPFNPSVTVQSFLPVSYQWYRNGSGVPGQTNNALGFTSVALTNAGTYVCVISNATAAVTSSQVILSVGSSVSTEVKNYQTAVRTNSSLISYYTFDNETADDSVGTNNGALMGSAEFIPGVGGGPDQALSLGGAGWAGMGPVPAFDFINGNGTVELWLRAGWNPSTTSYNPCIFADRDDANAEFNYSLYMSAAQNSIISYNPFNTPVTSTINLPSVAGTNWHHLAVVFTNGNWTVIWDGQSAGTAAFPLGASAASFDLGSSNPSGTEQWIGQLDEVALYGDALSSNAVTAEYDAFAAGNLPVISVQPQAASVFAGDPFSVFVGAQGAGLNYQWSKNGASIPSATNALYSITTATVNDAGTYYVLVSNSVGHITSSNALISVIVAHPSQYQSTVLKEPSLISFYSFDDQTANDSVSTNDGTLQGDASFTPGIGGGSNMALLVSGSGYVSFGEVPDFNFTNGGGSVEGWIRADYAIASPPSYNPCIFSARQDPAVDWSIHLIQSKQQIAFWNGNAVSEISIPYASTNWHHIAVTFSNGTWSVYWDGALAGSANEPFGTGTTAPADLGSSNPTGTEFWIGAMDQIAYYGTALSAADVLSHYDAMIGVTAAPTISIQRNGNQMTLSWSGSGFTLESSPTLPAKTWTPVTGVTGNSATITVSAGNMFYRLSQ